MKSSTLIAIVAVVAAMTHAPLNAQDLLIRGATVHTVTSQGTLERTDVLVRAGRISAVGRGITAPAGAVVIDAKNRSLTPGLYAGLSNIGLSEVWAESATMDATLNFSAPAWHQQWRPEFDVTRAYNPRSVVVPVNLTEGLTWTVLSPASADGVVAGQGAALTLDGRQEAVLDGSRSLFVNWDGPSPVAGGSRAALYMLFEQAIREVRASGPINEQSLLHPAGREVLAGYLNGGRVVFYANRAADIRSVIAFSRRNGMRPVISGGTEAWLVADDLARAQVPVILNPLENLPSGFNAIGARLDNAALLERAGVRIAFTPEDPHNARKIRQLAGNAVAHGLPWEAALAAITAAPAEIFGVATTRGRIAVGQVADMVLWDGDPLEVTTVADQVWVAGRAIQMRSRQSELRDRYFR